MYVAIDKDWSKNQSDFVAGTNSDIQSKDSDSAPQVAIADPSSPPVNLVFDYFREQGDHQGKGGSSSYGGQEYPPKSLIGDQVKIVVLLMLFLVGLPLNATAGINLRRAGKRLRAGLTNRERLDMHCLKRHLNIADLLILTVYGLTELIWTVTYSWNGGEIMCRAVMSARLFTVQASSNLVTCIAFNRFLTLTFPLPTACVYRIYIMLAGAWLMAAVLALPQLALWTTVKPFPKTAPTWTQCSSAWEIQRHQERLRTMLVAKFMTPNDNSTSDNSAHHTEPSSDLTTWTSASRLSQEVYNTIHLLSIFWIPLVFIALSYVALVFKLRCYSRATAFRMRREDVVSHSSHRSLGDAGASVEKHLTTTLAGYNSSGGTNDTNDELYFTAIRRLTAISHHNQAGVQNARRRTIRASVLIVTAYVLCWLPYNSLETMKIINRPWYERHTQEIQVLNVVIVFNSVINPFLYGMFGRWNPNMISNN